MSTFMTNGWMEGVKRNIPKCPACGGEVDYGFFVSKEPIQWAREMKGNRFTDLERPITGPFKKPLGVAMARCHSCALMITVFPPERE
jgi:hypothetical protein